MTIIKYYQVGWYNTTGKFEFSGLKYLAKNGKLETDTENGMPLNVVKYHILLP